MDASAAHQSFEWLRSENIDSLGVELQEYRHRITGARHIHLQADYKENVFLVAFRTVPKDSTGVAHVLEHTVLCGSERYPVRDPFFMMTRRSLSTFMNAFTASDWTAYPFASQNRKDFNNLLQVYLDAVFFSNLNELDFAQEGVRVELEDPQDDQSALVYKGVVFNEMKGAMSAPVSRIWQTLNAHLFPEITYHYNSGGEPEDIPNLTYQQLLSFYREHYHPSNALFLTFGDINASEHQKMFEECALHRFEAATHAISIPAQAHFSSPVKTKGSFGLAEQAPETPKSHFVMGWVIGECTDIDQLLLGHLLSGVLLDNSASPLRYALETTGLGAAPSPLCGLDDSMRDLVFSCGLEGCEDNDGAAIEQLIVDTLRQVAEQGVPFATVNAIVDQIELSQREIGGDGYPYGMQLMFNLLGPALHGADPLPYLAIEEALSRLRTAIQDEQFLPQLVRKYLLDNNHYVSLMMSPDAQYDQRAAQLELQKLAQLKASMSVQDRHRLVEQMQALEQRQAQVDDPGVLPKVGLADVPEEVAQPSATAQEQLKVKPQIPVTHYRQGTNGIVYQQLIIELPQIEPGLLQNLQLYTECLTEVGSAERDYLQTQHLQSQVTGGIHAFSSIRSSVDDVQRSKAYVVLSGKSLARYQREFTQLMRETLLQARFDEAARFRELITQIRFQWEQSVTNRGHSLALGAAVRDFSPVAEWDHCWKGLEGIRKIIQLDTQLEDASQLEQFIAQLSALHQFVCQGVQQALVISDAQHEDEVLESVAEFYQSGSQPAQSLAPLCLTASEPLHHQAWVTETQVNFCAKAFRTVPASHQDAPVLNVLGELLRNGFLHTAIRERGGAYGAGAGYDSDAGGFRFYSYRDPRLQGTLDDFDQSVRWLLSDEIQPRQLEEAILGVVSALDRPGSPAGEAKRAFYDQLHGRGPVFRKEFRERVLATTLPQIKQVAQQYLQLDQACEAVVVNREVAQALPAKFTQFQL